MDFTAWAIANSTIAIILLVAGVIALVMWKNFNFPSNLKWVPAVAVVVGGCLLVPVGMNYFGVNEVPDDGVDDPANIASDATFDATATVVAAYTAGSGSGQDYSTRIGNFNTTSGAFNATAANGMSGVLQLNFSVSRTDSGVGSGVCNVAVSNIGTYTRTTGATAGVTYNAIGTTTGGLTWYRFNSTYGGTAVVSKTGQSIQLRFPSTSTASTQYVLFDLHINAAYMDAIADDGLITYAHICDVTIGSETFTVTATLVSTVS